MCVCVYIYTCRYTLYFVYACIINTEREGPYVCLFVLESTSFMAVFSLINYELSELKVTQYSLSSIIWIL